MSKLKELKKDLDRMGVLDGCNEDLIDDAIAFEGSYRAESALKTLVHNLDKEGYHLAANMVREAM